MKCAKAKQNIYLWLDGELKGVSETELIKHLEDCPLCKEETESIRSFHKLIQESRLAIEPSSGFETTFWEKVLDRQKQPRLLRVIWDLELFLPVPSFSQALAVLLFAFFIGGAGGVLSAMNAVSPEQVKGERGAIQYLSGFQEFKGLPSASVAATYLKTVEKRSFS